MAGKYSEEANRLWPYLLPKVERVTGAGTGGASGSAGVGGAPTPHALNSAHHTGTLTAAQGPLYLLVDGTRDLTGNLAVSPGVTIDGVDLSAHVLLPDVHHNHATAGNAAIGLDGQIISLVVASSGGLQVSGAGAHIDLDTTPGLVLGIGGIKVLLDPAASGLQLTDGLAIADSVAGGGLTIASKILAVNPGDGIEVASDLVAVDLAANSGLAFSGGDLTMGAPSNATVSSTNSVTTTTHTHAVSTNSNVGLYGTVGATILASTAGGGLTLSNLDVTGSVDITDGGDLTVGANIFFVDASQESVGINRAPDPQFDLDVAGNLRATYIVGKHAIQLSDVLLLAHFDGKEPFEANAYGEPNGHMGQIGTGNNYATFRPGKFYKALQIARGITNYVTNPSFEVNVTDGWTYAQGGTGGFVERTLDNSVAGVACARIRASTAGWSLIQNTSLVTVPAASYVTLSCYVYDYGYPTDYSIEIRQSDTTTRAFENGTTSGNINEWQRLDVTWLNDTGFAIQLGAVIANTQNDGLSSLLFDAVQLELLAYASPYFDGSMILVTSSLAEAWSGTAHNSTSDRGDALFTYLATDNINLIRGTVMAWVYMTDDGGGTRLILGHDGGGGVAGLLLLRVTDGVPDFVWGSAYVSGGTVPVNTWTHIAATWNLGVVTLYVNGAAVATDSDTGPTNAASLLYVGGFGVSQWLDGLIDDLCIVGRACDPGLIRSIYESDAPVFAESSVFHFRATPKGLVWADDEGLWMRNVAGGNVLGAYGGETTKSWAGLTLSSSDFVLGDSNRGAYMLWDDSAGSITIGKTGASTGNLYLDGSSVKLRHNLVERFSLSSAGALLMKDGAGTERFAVSDAGLMTIKDSGGAAVFTFDASAGAEFTKPLKLGTNGGIYQGTGTFADPTAGTGIGLKIWNNAGVGMIAGYNAGVAQWYASTDGRLYAGAGNVTMDATGVRVKASATPVEDGSDWSVPSSLALVSSSGALIGGLTSAGTTDVSLASIPVTGDAQLYLFAAPLDVAWGGGTTWPKISMDAGTVAGSVLSLDAQDIVIGHNVTTSTDIIFKGDVTFEDGLETAGVLSSGQIIAPSMILTYDPGGTAGFITFGGNSNASANGAGVGTVKMKGTTSRDSGGFLKFYYGTSAIWIPFFYDITG